MTEIKRNQKNLQIETLRGLVILLVVIGHVIGSTPEGGMRIEYPSFWRYLYLLIYYWQLPLFTAIAGYVYGLKSHLEGSIFQFAKDKFIRLFIPMAVVGTLYFLLQYFTPGTNNKGDLWDIWRIYIFPFTLFWYLPSLFFMFLIQFSIDRFRPVSNAKGYFLLFVLAYGVAVLVKKWDVIEAIPNLFSFKGGLILFPSFLLGVMCSRMKGLTRSALSRRVALACGLICVGLIQWEYFGMSSYPDWIRSYLFPLLVCGVLIGLFALPWNNRFFVWLGSYAYGIYLFHGFGTAGGRIVMSYLHIHGEVVVFFFSLFIALAGSVLASYLVCKNRWLALLFLGIRQK